MMSRGDGEGQAGRGGQKGNRTARLDKAARDNRSRQLNPNDPTYHASRASGNGRGSDKGAGDSPRVWMDREAASRIQSHADKSGRNQGFKERAQSAADRNDSEDN